MNFTSILFIFCFIPIFFTIYYLIPNKKRYLIILLGSIVFYLSSGLLNFFIILSLSLINFITVKLAKKYNCNIIYYVLIIINIIVLAFFKYKSVIFPLGISFYTFNNLSYIIDVKRNKIKEESNLLYYFTYVLLFTHISMGPIVRYKEIKESLINLSPTNDEIVNGFKRFLFGLYKKVLIADNLGILFNNLLNNNNQSFLSVILMLVAFALQLYIDFSSYSDMALGLGKMLGINYRENFDHPYLSTSISQYWRVWHISLGEFFKEYVYFPLGGNKVSTKRNILNLLIVWLLTGIWHGNTFNFLIWGIYYGIIIIIEKYILKKYFKNANAIIKHIYVIIVVLIGYLFFSLKDLETVKNVVYSMFSNSFINNTFIFYLKENIFYLIVGIILCFKPIRSIKEYIDNNAYLTFIVNVCYIILFLIVISHILNNSFTPFLYNAF